ncbi:MAG: YfbK domain-containing protein [Planctomycetota bacterium]
MKRIDETKLTDYVMGELDASARAEVEAAMAEDEQLRTQCEELQRTLNLLQEPQLQPVLGQDRREALRAAAREPQAAAVGSAVGSDGAAAASGSGKGRLLQFPGIKYAAAFLIFGGALVVWSEKYGGERFEPATSQAAALDALGYGGGHSQSMEAMGYVGGSADSAPESEIPLSLTPIMELGYAAETKPALGGGAGGRLGKDSKVGKERGTYKGPGDSVPNGNVAWDFGQGVGTPEAQLGALMVAPDAAAPVQTPTIGYMSTPGSASSSELQESMLPDPTLGPLGQLEKEGDDLRDKLRQRDQGLAESSTPSAPATPGAPKTSSDGQQWDRLAKDDEQAALLSRTENLYDADMGLALEALGYNGLVEEDASGAYFDDFGDGDTRGRIENIRGAYEDRLRKQHEEPICTLTDGYGRRYVDAQVIDHLHPAHPQETPQDMFFRFYGDNPEVFSRFESLSTFAADVDTASYPMARNYLVNDQLPPKAAIRTEEFLNYFDYAMPAPTEDDFTVYLNAGETVFGDDRLLVSIGVKAREVLANERPPMNLVFVLDKSGSMAGERMQLVKDALMLLVDQIRDTDTIGLVTFDSTGHVVLEPTQGHERYRIRKAIRSLSTGGSTNAAQGLALGYGLMEKVYDPKSINRVVLASDGVANTGETDQTRILKNVTERAEARVDLTTLGVGMGNHNDVFLEQLADQGNGSCHYLDDVEEAERVLVEGFLGTMITVARDVKIQVEFEEEQVLRWRQLGYENRSLAHQDFRNDAVDAGEVGSGHEVVALYEVQPSKNASAEGNLVTVRLRWKPEGSEKAVERSYSLDLAAASSRWELAPVRLRQQAVVAQYAEVLRRSVHSRTDSYEQLVAEATRLVKELSGEAEVSELRDMIRRTRDLARWTAPDDRISMLVEEARRQRLLEAELAMAAHEVDVEELLEQVRQQNRDLEGQLQDILQRD